jgi:hypothetical protein
MSIIYLYVLLPYSKYSSWFVFLWFCFLQTIQPWYREFITKFESEYLILVGPTTDPYRLPIVQYQSCHGAIESTDRWKKFCVDNGFGFGDVLLFNFRNIKISSWVDVEKIE